MDARNFHVYFSFLVISGGPLSGTYRLEQFHLHWGATDDIGSEHTINGTCYSAELHLVHFNCGNYKTFAEAVDKPDGLAVFGVMVEIGKEHAGFESITDVASKVLHKGQSTKLSKTFDPNCLLPADTSRYWTYPGSLTTPPLYESVTWIVFSKAISISREQGKDWYASWFSSLVFPDGSIFFADLRPPQYRLVDFLTVLLVFFPDHITPSVSVPRSQGRGTTAIFLEHLSVEDMFGAVVVVVMNFKFLREKFEAISKTKKHDKNDTTSEKKEKDSRPHHQPLTELSEEKIQELKESFTLFDKNGDGMITKEELSSVLYSLGVRPSVLELQAMITTVDIDKSGTIDFDEFMKIFQRKLSVDIETELHDVFCVFDKDKDGGISPGELYEVLNKLGEIITEGEARAMVREADLNRDGKVDYKEFKAILNYR
ncbi:hypothetical protein CHS0354_038557 [Potamilus streckersoni]|uniref:Carbonic anhydrase n=1 Tax=Potamilus streckersoni TaxID=2493646 RepID=A0AAE0RRU0_9BIVA|nr:hypothetical protein CHS0354_038557 [Potamilus streckersoni]